MKSKKRRFNPEAEKIMKEFHAGRLMTLDGERIRDIDEALAIAESVSKRSW